MTAQEFNGAIKTLRHLIHLHSCEQEGIESGQPTASDWYHGVENAHIAIDLLEQYSNHNKPEEKIAQEALDHLEWIYGRMHEVHNENENYDYMLKFKEILNAINK